jgi:hypothetical protein
MTWIFDCHPQNLFFTTALASLVSVVYMPNVIPYLQLGFLAMLGYSSLADILATQIAPKFRAHAPGGGTVAAAVREKVAWSRYSEPTFVCILY